MGHTEDFPSASYDAWKTRSPYEGQADESQCDECHRWLEDNDEGRPLPCPRCACCRHCGYELTSAELAATIETPAARECTTCIAAVREEWTPVTRRELEEVLASYRRAGFDFSHGPLRDLVWRLEER